MSQELPPRRRRSRFWRILRSIIVVLIMILTPLLLIVLLVGLFLGFGGAKTVLETALPYAMNGYISVDEASYFYFADFNAENLKMVLEHEDEQETVVSVGDITVDPWIFPLLDRRMEFGEVYAQNLDLNLRVLPNGRMNIDQLFYKGPPKKGPNIFRVYPPHYAEVRNVNINFEPYTYSPVHFDEVNVAFHPLSYQRVQVLGFGDVMSPMLGTGTISMYLDMDDMDYIIAYQGDYIVVDSEMIERLPLPPNVRLNQMVAPSGRILPSILVVGHGKEVQHRIVNLGIDFDNLTIRSLQYPLAIVDLNGKLTSDGKVIKLKDITCIVPISDSDASLRLDGILYEKDTYLLEAELTNAQLTDDYLAYLPVVNKAKNYVSINGEAGMHAKVYNKKGWDRPRVWSDFTFRGQVIPLQIPVPIFGLEAQIRTLARGAVVVDDLSVEVGEGIARSKISVSGTYDPAIEAGQFFFQSPSFRVSNDLVARVPQLPQFVSTNLRISGESSIAGEIVHTPERNILDARAELLGFQIGEIKHPEFGINGITGTVQYSDDYLSVKGLKGDVLGGTIKLNFDTNLSFDSRSYSGDLTLSDLNLQKIPDEYLKDIAGYLSGTLHFTGKQFAAPDVLVDGNLRVREGRLISLPVIFSIINFLNLQLPGETIFTAAVADFNIKNEKINIKRVELNSRVLNVYVKGMIGFDGKLDLRAGVGYRQPFLEDIPIVGPVLGWIGGALRSALTTVQVTGTLSDPNISLLSVSYLTSPINFIADFFSEKPKQGQR